MRNSASCGAFQKVILNISRPEPNHVFNTDSSKGLNFLPRIRIGTIITIAIIFVTFSVF